MIILFIGSNKYLPYTEEISMQIEKAFISGEETVKIMHGRFKYQINLFPSCSNLYYLV
jgi:hypothetical protein